MFHDTPDTLRLRIDVHLRSRAFWLAEGRSEQAWCFWLDELEQRLAVALDPSR